MQYLARREYSRAELRTKLFPYVAEGEDLDAVLDALVQSNWLSDDRAAEQFVQHRRSRFGAQRIAMELRRKGISDHLIDEAMPQLQASELETAREVWRKKFSDMPNDPKEKARQARFLQSRGFSLDIIMKILRFPDGSA